MRITLPNLTPGTTYVIKARSKSGADYSEWSRSITLTTSGDALPPKTPANPVGSMNGTSFSLKWDAVTQNSDSTALNDLDRYEVEVTSAGTATVGVYPTKDTKFEFSFEQNANLFGSPRANIKMRVRAVDLVGNASAYTSIVDQTNPAPAAPTGLAGNAGTYSLSFTWNAVADLDLKQYRIYSGTSAGTQSTLVWTGTALNATIQLVDTTTDRWYKVVAVDVFNTESTTSNVVGPIKPLSPVVVDVTPPAVPTNLAGTLTNATDGKTASMAVTWTGVSDNDLDSYVVAFRQFASPVNDWQYVTVSRDATSTTIQGLVPYKAHDIRIRAKDFSANYSNWTTIVAVSAQANTAPATVTGLAATAGKDNLQISWTESADADVANNAGAYEVTVATNSGFTTGVLNYKTAATTLSVNGLAQNTQYYVRVRAVDSAGLTSAAWSTSANATTSNFSGGSDGAVPVGAVTLSASAGLGYIYLSWTPLTNNDPVVYDVYMSTTSGFTTYDATTKITEVSGTSAFIDTVVAGTTLVYGTTYYFKVRARDKDGVSTSVSNQASAAPVKAAIGDISATPRQLGVPIITTAATAPSSPITGDIWNDTTTGQEKTWSGSAWTVTGNVSEKYVTSKGTDLITNGSGLLGSNYNFLSTDYNGADAPNGANGSFVTKNGFNQSVLIDEMIAFDPSKRYKFSFQCRQTITGQTNTMYGFFAPYDASNLSIQPYHYMYVAGTTTTLAADLNPGATTITLTSSANWYGQAGKVAGSSGYLRNIIFWDYVDAFGKAWPTGSYSRNLLSNGVSMWADGGITGNVITLSAPYAGVARLAGTPVSNATSGGSYMYMPSATAVVVPETWTAYSDVFNAGILNPASQAVAAGGGAGWTTGAPPGTAKIKVGWLLNYPTGGTGRHAIAAVSLSDASAAQDAANNASKTYIQSSTPVGRTQDLWIDTTGGNNTPKRWNGSAWVAVTDKAATDAAAAATASSMTYIQSTAPTGRSQDLWIDTTAGANTPKRWNGSAWVAVTDQNAIAAAQSYTDTKFQATLKNSVVEYAMNASETVAPTTGWSTTPPTRTPGNFIWYRTVLTYGDNSTTTSSAALLTGNTGATGATGATGPTGAPAPLVSLTANTQVLTSPAGGGATNPATSTVTGTALNTTITVWEYSVDGSAFSATVPAGASRSGNVVTITGSTMTARTIAVRMADANGVADTLTIAKVSDGAAGATGSQGPIGNTGATGPTGSTGAAGADAYTVILTNEAQVFPGTTSAAVAGNATTQVIAYKGAAQQTATIGTITGQVTGLTTAITNNGTNSPTVTVTVTNALVTQSGTLTIPVTVGGIVFTKTFAWSVSYTGATGATGPAGANAADVNLTATSQVLTSPAAGGATNPATSTVTGVATNTTITAWTYSVDGAAFSATVPAGVSRAANVVTITGSTMTARTIAVRMADANGVADTLTVAKAFDGAAGATGATGNTGPTGNTGAAGADAYTVILTNESQVFAGTTTNAVADATKSTTVIAYKGAVQQTASITQANITGLPTGMTAAVTNNNSNNVTVTFTVTTAMTSASGAVTIPVVVGGITFNKIFSYSIAFTGAQGATGSTGPAGTNGTNGVSITAVTPFFAQVTPANATQPADPTGTTPSTPWTPTEPAYIANSAMYRSERITYSSGSPTWTTVYRSSAYDAAATAQATANGKNNILRSTSDATGSSYTNGDLWWKLDVNGNVIKQWKFVTGTGWVVEVLNDGVLGSLDANKIVAGSTFTQTLNVKSKFILGDASTTGTVESYNYVLNTSGFTLSSAGLQINNGDIDAKTLRANSAIITTLFVGAGGAVQSTGFNASTGFQLSTSGLIIRGAGNSVDVGAVTAGTITGKQWIMGTGGSFIVDQDAYFQSNNYSGGTLGWRLDSTGLTIRNGSIDAKALISSTIDTATLTLSGPNGKIVGSGFTLAGNGLTVTTGSISAPALLIQSGASNLAEPQYSAFEFTPSFYTGKFLGVNSTTSIQTTGGMIGSQFVRMTTTATGQTSLILGDTGTDYHIPVEAGKTYIVSGWMKAATATAVSAYLRLKYSDGTFSTQTAQTLPASGPWVRYSFPATAPAGVTGAVVQVFNTTTTAGVGVDVDGVMVEQQVGGLTTPSTYTMPGMTSADGGILRTGQIQSNTNVTVNSVTQPAWSINMSGGAQFGNAVVRGTMIVGASGADVDAGQSFIASGNFVASTTGWKIDSAGNLEANQGLFRGSLNVGGRAGSTVSIIAGDPIGIRAEMTDFGFKSYAIGDEGVVYESVSLGTSSDNKFEIHNAAGDTVAGIDATGVLTAGGANLGSSTGPTFDTDGNFLTGVQIYGQEFQRIIDALPRGIVASVYSNNFQVTGITTPFGMAECSFTAEVGRNYRIMFNGMNITPTVSGDRAMIALRYTTDGTAPTITSPVIDRQIVKFASAETVSTPPIMTNGSIAASTVTCRLLITVERLSGTGTLQVSTNVPSAGYKAFRFWVEDTGPDVPDTFLINQGNGQIGGGAAQPPPAAAKKTYVKTYTSIASGSYRETGVKRTDNGGKIYQGRSSAGSINGIQQGLWVFPDMTGDLSGATISKVEVYLYANFWYYNSGGTASIATHAHTAVPASSPTQTYRVASTNWPKPGGRWVTLPNPTNTVYPSFVSGAIRGIGVYTASPSLTLYGSFNSTAQIRITYVK